MSPAVPFLPAAEGGCSVPSGTGRFWPQRPANFSLLCLRRFHFFQQRKGDAPCPRARVTFGRSPKSDQKRCLKPQVSRLPARLGCAENRGRVPRENQDSADRRTTNRVRPSYRCRSCVPREVRWSTAVGERLSRRSAKYSFGRRMKNGLLDPREVMCAAGERWDRAAFRMRQYSRGSGY